MAFTLYDVPTSEEHGRLIECFDSLKDAVLAGEEWNIYTGNGYTVVDEDGTTLASRPPDDFIETPKETFVEPEDFEPSALWISRYEQNDG